MSASRPRPQYGQKPIVGCTDSHDRYKRTGAKLPRYHGQRKATNWDTMPTDHATPKPDKAV